VYFLTEFYVLFSIESHFMSSHMGSIIYQDDEIDISLKSVN